MDLASALYRVRGESEMLKVETLRFLQKRVDLAYAEGVKLYQEGHLPAHLSREVAIGNFMDRRVRNDVRSMYNRYRINYGKRERIKLIGREYDTSGSDRTYTVPDSMIDRLAMDWTMTQKTLATRQVRKFFMADIGMDAVIIIMPSQISRKGVYLIKRPIR